MPVDTFEDEPDQKHFNAITFVDVTSEQVREAKIPGVTVTETVEPDDGQMYPGCTTFSMRNETDHLGSLVVSPATGRVYLWVATPDPSMTRIFADHWQKRIGGEA